MYETKRNEVVHRTLGLGIIRVPNQIPAYKSSLAGGSNETLKPHELFVYQIHNYSLKFNNNNSTITTTTKDVLLELFV